MSFEESGIMISFVVVYGYRADGSRYTKHLSKKVKPEVTTLYFSIAMNAILPFAVDNVTIQ